MLSRIPIFALVALGVSLVPAIDSFAADNAELEGRISELEVTVRRLEALLEQQSEPKPQPTRYADTRIQIGGYVKTDAILSKSSNAPIRGAGEDLFIPSTITTSGDPTDARLNVHARETRFWLKSFTPTDHGDVTTHLEVDFMLGLQGDERVGNSYSPRIRHATVNWGRWTTGQTWSNFFNVSALPEYLDFIGPVGTIFVRQPQVRYAVPRADGSWMISLENPESTLTPYLGGSRIDADDGSWPDLIIRRNWSGDWGNVSVAAMLRELKISDDTYNAAAAGGAIGIAGKLNVGGRDDFRWQLNAGNALGRYLGLNAFNAGALDADGNINPLRQYGIVGAYRHVWSDTLYSTFGASFARADNDTSISLMAVPRSYQSAHLNLIWSPVGRMTVGAEYLWGRRVDESGDDGVLNRVQLSAKYVY